MSLEGDRLGVHIKQRVAAIEKLRKLGLVDNEDAVKLLAPAMTISGWTTADQFEDFCDWDDRFDEWLRSQA